VNILLSRKTESRPSAYHLAGLRVSLVVHAGPQHGEVPPRGESKSAASPNGY